MKHLLHARVVDETSVGAGSCYDKSGSKKASSLLQLVIIYETCLGLRGIQEQGVERTAYTFLCL